MALGTIYGAGIAVAYGSVGLVSVLTGSRFGSLNASPLFNTAIAVLFGVLSLAMFGVFAIDFSRFLGAVGGSDVKKGFVTIFLMGAVAALLAGACVAPVVISVLVLSTEFYAAGNVFADNERGIIVQQEEGATELIKSEFKKNVFWNNQTNIVLQTTDVYDMEKDEIIEIQPDFIEPENGNFTLTDPSFKGIGLREPKVIFDLWQKYKEYENNADR